MTLDESWEKVSIKINKGVAENWFPPTIYCFATNKNCQNCLLFTVHGYRHNDEKKECKVPQSVQILLNKGKKPPKGKLKQLIEGYTNGEN